jgi:hypothetical protein
MTNAEILASYQDLQAQYEAYRAEARACGFEVETFSEWEGQSNPKADAQDRAYAVWDDDTWDLY